MIDLEREIYDVGSAIFNTLKETSDPALKVREDFKEQFARGCLMKIAMSYVQHVKDLSKVYDKLESAGDAAESARSHIKNSVFESLSYLQRYRTGMRELNDKIDFYTATELDRLDELVDKCWRDAKPYLPG